MKSIKWLWLPVAMLASFLAVGIPYWRIPYHSLNLPNALLTPWLLVAVLAALLLCVFRAAPFWLATPAIAVSVMAVVVVRVMTDTAHDPTSHNLWPLEYVIAFPVALFAAIAGALPGSLIAMGRRARATGS